MKNLRIATLSLAFLVAASTLAQAQFVPSPPIPLVGPHHFNPSLVPDDPTTHPQPLDPEYYYIGR